MKHILASLALIVCVLGENVEILANDKNTLEILHVVFRHGDRTPDNLYPNDPYTEEDFYPIRIGHLTNKGKMTAYNIGTSLRKRYKTFIPDVYTPEIIQSISSHYPRTKASLQLVLAGLFPPTAKLRWNNKLAWEPIPYDSLESSHNKLFFAMGACPNFIGAALKTLQNYNDPIADKYKNLLPFLQEVSGYPINDVVVIGSLLYSTLKAEQEHGLELPAWSNDLYPEILDELSSRVWLYQSIGDLKTLSAGFLVSRILNNTQSTIQGDESFKDTKVYLYAGHDTNVAALLVFLDNFVPHNPNYGAHIIVEVHNIAGKRYLKFLHEDYQYKEPVPLNIPNCGVYCDIETFERLYAKHLDPAHQDALCG